MRATMAEYARQHAVSRNSVSRWKSDGFLVLDDNLVDVEASDALLRGAHLGRFRAAVDVTPEPDVARHGDTVERDDTAPPDVDPEALAEDADAFIKRVLAGDYDTIAQAERVKQNALALKHVLEVRERAHALVSRDAAEREVFEIARSWRDTWLNWSSKVAPLLAADLGIEPDALAGLLSGYVHRQLLELGEPTLDLEVA